jgi:ketosteroid isomerase-like protein
MDVKTQVEQFVEAFNAPRSDVYPLFGDQVDWIEMPSGRSGDRDALFAAFRQSRSYFSDLKMVAISITAGESDAVLESELTLTSADGAIVRARTIWIFGYENGRIAKQHDYSFVLKQPDAQSS